MTSGSLCMNVSSTWTEDLVVNTRSMFVEWMNQWMNVETPQGGQAGGWMTSHEVLELSRWKAWDPESRKYNGKSKVECSPEQFFFFPRKWSGVVTKISVEDEKSGRSPGDTPASSLNKIASVRGETAGQLWSLGLRMLNLSRRCSFNS